MFTIHHLKRKKRTKLNENVRKLARDKKKGETKKNIVEKKTFRTFEI